MMEKDENLVINCIRNLDGGKTSKETLEELYEGGLKKFQEDFVKYIQK